MDGVSPEIGLVGGYPITIEDVAMFVSDRGPYLASDRSVKDIGHKVRPVFDFADRTSWEQATLVHNRRRKEAWVFVPSTGSGTAPGPLMEAWVYNYEMQSWWGPWSFSFNVSAACRYERSTGQESVLLGGYDGYVRDGDVDAVGGKDDVLYDGTGGTDITIQIVYAPVFFGSPERMKLAGPTWFIDADLKGTGELTLGTQNETGQSWSMQIPTMGTGPYSYRARPAFRGKCITVTITESSSSLIEVHSLSLEARLGRRG
jgi:hypothetical protein